MKITKSILRRMIREELDKDADAGDYVKDFRKSKDKPVAVKSTPVAVRIVFSKLKLQILVLICRSFFRRANSGEKTLSPPSLRVGNLL